ncbi:N-6 DNA methylase [Acinetobacter sp. NIPH1876]|uniref:N-6 DNA methylase n=1 Tax=Acinetobacter sp. NIPH1876 TaxID=2924041 RepID=UPI001FAC8687|nr:N-6 DNA methylase [Acinetobacter sp. NIPH1876]MCJ0830502.1 N-6 DNA methylase [Acinetobacter sp. NIPH1876]
MNRLISLNESLKVAIEQTNLMSLDAAIDLDSIDLVLRELLTIDEMREAGSFFTGQILATATVKNLLRAITFESVVLDPTCGAGNLLIECSRVLGVERNLSNTLQKWGTVLWGYDIHESFVESTKLRLVIEALRRGVQKDCTLEEALSFLVNIKVKDALTITKKDIFQVTHAIMNPPFSIWPSPNKYYWKSGKINAAGIVFDHFIRILPEGCCFSAILPDVLRSGSRYRLFRDFCSLKTIATCQVWGRFNKKTDVDVFLLFGNIVTEDQNIQIKWQESFGNYIPLSEKFEVRTGPLVAYRDPEIGPEYAYFHSRNTPSWETLSMAKERRRFKGTVISPPFIIVKRTSSPGDKYRASASLIDLNEMVAVENHMIVIKPKNNSLAECNKLMKILKSEKTNNFLNSRIRLRHLTVQVIKDIPIKKTS